MAISKNKCRIDISLPKEQANWLKKFAKEHNRTASEIISFFLAKKAQEITELLQMSKNKMTKLQYDELVRIAKTPWLNV